VDSRAEQGVIIQQIVHLSDQNLFLRAEYAAKIFILNREKI